MEASTSSSAEGVGKRLGTAVRSVVVKSGPVTRGLACAILVGFVFQLALGDVFRKQFALVPAKVIPKFWMLETAALVEMNVLQLVVNLASLFFVASHLEPLWGWKEMAKFLAIVNFAGFALLMATYIFNFILARTVTVLYAQFGGFTVSVAGLFVGLKQALPDEELNLGVGSGFSLRYKNLPLLYLGVSLIVTGIFEDGSIFFMSLYGTLAAWFYIRKFGDQSEGMRLVTLFPEATHSTIENLSTQASQIFSKGGGPSKSRDKESLLPISDNPEAARRRERGAKLLEERLAKPAAPTNEDDAAPTSQGGEVP